MSNDNKTLADAQPGGRVRLGDQRSDLVPGIVRCAKCAFQLHRTNLYLQSGTVGAGDSKTEPCPNGCGPLWPVTWETWAREGWAEAERLHLENAALSAQPSPGGQGDALQILANYLCVPVCDLDMEDTMSLQGAVEAIDLALDPRQPVRIYGCCAQPEGELHTAECPNMRHLAARQPVGAPITVEAVATVRRNGDGDRYIDWLTEGGIADLEVGDVLMVSDRAITDEDGSGEVYATPRAQAVDLGQFRPAVELMEWQERGHAHPDFPEGNPEKHAEALRLLALIDSKAVSNGQ